MPSPVPIRHGGAPDVPLCQALEKASRARYRDWPPLAFAAEPPPIAADRFQDGALVLAGPHDAPLGFTLLKPLDGLLYVVTIAVAPDASGRGVGAALLGEAVDLARTQARAALILTTFKAPPWNGPWFRRHGFAPMPDAEIGPGLRAVIDRQSQTLDPTTREALWRRL